MKYRKKPVVIEAFRFGYDEIPIWAKKAHLYGKITFYTQPGKSTRWAEIDTLEGKHIVRPGDYIIKGVKGEFYPCKPDIFKMTYEPVLEGAKNDRD